MSQSYLKAKQWRIDRAKGLKRTTPSAKTAQHIEDLRNAGWSYRGIADTAGVSVQTVNRVHRGVQKSVVNETETRVLALKSDSIFTRPNKAGFVPNVGARRRLQALLAIGYRHSDITPLLGSPSGTLMHQVGDWISLEKHEAMVRVYEQLWDKPGPAPATSRARIRKAGYLPPLAWDDESIDDPNFVPEPTEVTAGSKVEVRRDAFLQEVEHLAGFGGKVDDIAAQLGMPPKTLCARIERYERPDLLRRIGQEKRSYAERERKTE